MRIWIYALVESDTGEVKYIGQSNNPAQRLAGHRGPRSTMRREVIEWKRELRSRGATIEMVILDEVAGQLAAELAETRELEKRAHLDLLLNARSPGPKSERLRAAMKRWRQHTEHGDRNA